jgi:ABC-type antimicrobial peptide transport system, ATPase component
MDKQIVITNLSKVYHQANSQEVKALNNVNLEINKGESVSIMGVSGSGKTTLLNCIGLLDDYSEGEIIIDNQDVATFTDKEAREFRKNNFGYITQDYKLILNNTVYANVMFPLIFSNKYKNNKERSKRVHNVINMVGLNLKDKNKIKDLSLSDKERVAIARAIVNDPEIILADEPTDTLDSNNKLQIMNIYERLYEEGKTIIIVTHDHEIARLMKSTYYMIDGSINKCKLL